VPSFPDMLLIVADDHGYADRSGHRRSYEHAPRGDGWFLATRDVDPAEEHNLYDADPAVAAELVTLHEPWRTEVGIR
jgi:hypothetical protein